MKRYAWVTLLKPEKADEYKRLHEQIWPGVLDTLRECHIRNFSIFLRDNYLFCYFEYTGNNFAEELEKVFTDHTTQEWLRLSKLCVDPMPTQLPSEWWARMVEIFHCD